MSCFWRRAMDSEGERQAAALKCWTDRSQSAIWFQLANVRLASSNPLIENDQNSAPNS
jgi:hypothetical protein